MLSPWPRAPNPDTPGSPRPCRGYVERCALDASTYSQARAIGERIQEMRRRHRASRRLGAWYRGRLYTQRFRATRQRIMILQSLVRRELARKFRARRVVQDRKETAAQLKKGLAVLKFKSGRWRGNGWTDTYWSTDS
jgi:hypothetical protein